MLYVDPVKLRGGILAKVDVESISNDYLGLNLIDIELILIVDKKTKSGLYGTCSLVLCSHDAKVAKLHLILLSSKTA